MTLNLLYANEYRINDYIAVKIPTVGEVLADEDAYFSAVLTFTSMPIDMMVQLDEVGIDFTTINEWELFLLMFGGLQQMDTSLILGDLDLKSFVPVVNEKSKMIVLKDSNSDAVIDRLVLAQIANTLRKINYFKKDRRKPGNEAAKKYMIERARIKMKRKQKRAQESELEKEIVALVNTEQYKYDFERTRELSIYQFNQCVHQIIKKIDYDNRMIGVYAGTVKAKELSQDDLNWFVHT